MGNEQGKSSSGEDKHVLQGTMNILQGQGKMTKEEQDQLVARLKERGSREPSISNISISETGDSVSHAPGPGQMPMRRRQSRRGASINIEQIKQVRESLSQFTKSLDFWKQLELVTGEDARQAEVEYKDEESSETDATRAEKQDAPRKAPVIGSALTAQRKAEEAEADKKTSEKELKRIKEKTALIQEIQASEQLYHKFLRILVDKFIEPLSEMLDEDDIQSIFSNIKDLAPYHKAIAEKLQRTSKVAAVLAKYAPELKVYQEYVVNYDNALITVARLKKNKDFNQFLKSRRSDPECGGLDLTSFLIMPIQRIPRYQLLLRQLDKLTTEADGDKQLIQEAMDAIQHIANYVNEAKREAESRSKIVAIQNRMSGEFDNLLSPNRRWIMDGPVTQKTTLFSKPMHLYLFTDMLLWCTPEYEFKGVVTLATCTMEEWSHPKKYGFIIKGAALDQDTTFVVRSNSEKNRWTIALTDAINTTKRTFMMSRNRSFNRRSRKFSTNALMQQAAKEPFNKPK